MPVTESFLSKIESCVVAALIKKIKSLMFSWEF